MRTALNLLNTGILKEVNFESQQIPPYGGLVGELR